jgi:hypothetical protein
MPRGDRTGPEGEGPLTGRQAGFCAGNDRPGYAEPGPGYAGYGRGFGGRRFAGRPFGGGRFGGRRGGGGYRWRNWFYATGVPGWARFGPAAGVPPAGAPVDEAAALKTQAEWLRGELDAIDQRLQELDQQE